MLRLRHFGLHRTIFLTFPNLSGSPINSSKIRVGRLFNFSISDPLPSFYKEFSTAIYG